MPANAAIRRLPSRLSRDSMTDLCRQFGVSRKTSYKIFDRYKEHGLEALTDRYRRPLRYTNQLPSQIESLSIRLKRDKLHWGARKIRELLVRRLAGDVKLPLWRPARDCLFLTKISSSRPAAACASTARRSTSRPCWRAKDLESRKSTMAFGSSASGTYDLGCFDLEQRTLQPLDNPFGPRLSPMS